jgi:hypothetical protein
VLACAGLQVDGPNSSLRSSRTANDQWHRAVTSSSWCCPATAGPGSAGGRSFAQHRTITQSSFTPRIGWGGAAVHAPVVNMLMPTATFRAALSMLIDDGHHAGVVVLEDGTGVCAAPGVRGGWDAQPDPAASRDGGPGPKIRCRSPPTPESRLAGTREPALSMPVRAARMYRRVAKTRIMSCTTGQP